MNNYPFLDAFLLQQPGATKDYKLEWGWWRYQVGGKLFAATIQSSPEHPLLRGRELLNLKCDPARSELLRAEFPDIIPGYYADKRHWISVFLDGAVPEDVLRDLCQSSHRLVLEKLPKKAQREILSQL